MPLTAVGWGDEYAYGTTRVDRIKIIKVSRADSLTRRQLDHQSQLLGGKYVTVIRVNIIPQLFARIRRKSRADTPYGRVILPAVKGVDIYRFECP